MPYNERQFLVSYAANRELFDGIYNEKTKGEILNGEIHLFNDDFTSKPFSTLNTNIKPI